MTVVPLPSAAERRADDNLALFVTKAKTELKPYGDVDWDAIVWDVTPFEKKRGGQARKSFRIMFTRLDRTGTRLIDGKEPFEQPFADLVRALIVHRQESQPKTALNQMVTVRACRYIHEELAAEGFDPALLTLDHFVRAIAAARDREADSSAYRVGVAMAEVASTIDGYHLAKTRIDFKNPIPRNKGDSRVDEESVRRSQEKLPSEAALNGLAKIANQVSSGPDVMRMRVIELLVAGGFRINELLSVPENCLVQRPALDPYGDPLLDANGQPITDIGIRYWPEKGGPIDIKWIATPMADGARRAIVEISDLTQDARALARWLFENPGKQWLPRNLDAYDREQLVEVKELAPIAGVNPDAWCRYRKVPLEKVDGRLYVRRRDLESALLRMQRTDPMVIKPVRQELHDSLFVCFHNFMHSEKATNPCVVSTVTQQHISDVLVGRDGQPTLFDLHQIKEEDGSPIQLTTHMFRHWLNTVAQEGGMSQHEIARWMGRKRIEDNAAYDHVSGFKMAEKAREMFKRGEVVGGMKALYDRLSVADRERFLNSQIRTAHTTAYGLCMNDWSLMPCAKHGKCLDCGELLVEKGNQAQQQETDRIYQESSLLLRYAEEEAADDTYGANNFVDHNRRMVSGAARALAVHADPAIPNGTMVHLNPGAPSLFQMLDQGVDPINESEIAAAIETLGGYRAEDFHKA